MFLQAQYLNALLSRLSITRPRVWEAPQQPHTHAIKWYFPTAATKQDPRMCLLPQTRANSCCGFGQISSRLTPQRKGNHLLPALEIADGSSATIDALRFADWRKELSSETCSLQKDQSNQSTLNQTSDRRERF